MKEGIQLHLVCSIYAGFMATNVTAPFDLMKSRFMSSKRGDENYGNIYSTIKNIWKTEGFFGFYKGYTVVLIRNVPHTIIGFLVFEKLRKSVGIRPV